MSDIYGGMPFPSNTPWTQGGTSGFTLPAILNGARNATGSLLPAFGRAMGWQQPPQAAPAPVPMPSAPMVPTPVRTMSYAPAPNPALASAPQPAIAPMAAPGPIPAPLTPMQTAMAPQPPRPQMPASPAPPPVPPMNLAPPNPGPGMPSPASMSAGAGQTSAPGGQMGTFLQALRNAQPSQNPTQGAPMGANPSGLLPKGINDLSNLWKMFGGGAGGSWGGFNGGISGQY